MESLTLVNVAIAFAAGMLSFLSPCLLPLVPGYLAFLTGTSTADADAVRGRLVRRTLVFVASFTTVFVALGMGAGLLGGALLEARRPIEIVGGSLIAAMGALLLLQHRLPIGFQRRIGSRMPRAARGRGIDAAILGVVFAAAWSPCLGPALAAILTLAASEQQALSGGVLLLVYALGLGVPFLAVAVGAERATPLLARVRRHSAVVQTISGLLLLMFGIAVALGLLGALSARLSGISTFSI